MKKILLILLMILLLPICCYAGNGARITKIAYDIDGNPEYIGTAESNTLTSAAFWQIMKLTYVGSNVTDIKWCNGSNDFKYAWDSKATYTYR